MQLYSCCFAFNAKRTHVLLLRKAKPEWQAGLLNGIGGKTSFAVDATIMDTTIREFKEETGLMGLGDFNPLIYHAMCWPEYKTHTGWPLVYFSAGILSDQLMLDAVANTVRSPEPCTIQPLAKIVPSNMMSNLPFLIEMALCLAVCSPEDRKLRQPIVLSPTSYTLLVDHIQDGDGKRLVMDWPE